MQVITEAISLGKTIENIRRKGEMIDERLKQIALQNKLVFIVLEIKAFIFVCKPVILILFLTNMSTSSSFFTIVIQSTK